jgi:hypothetical protein
MNWDAIGAIAETLGAIGVIASLVYLATQIRQSRDQMRAATYQQMQATITDRVCWASQSPEIEEAVRLGLRDFERLSDEDAFRFNLWASAVTMACENSHYQYRIGMLDEDRWQNHRSAVELSFGSPGFAQWWRSNPPTPGSSPEFIALVEEILAEEPDRGE